ncbi:hypothetical protein GCM10009776_37310 [Microbacterium deminutum]|uniref:Uncharacterized protein n=1 Tax=Microbacterium deminutum TaxID=344164 RepID=A0ABN2RLF6_9MICO
MHTAAICSDVYPSVSTGADSVGAGASVGVGVGVEFGDGVGGVALAEAVGVGGSAAVDGVAQPAIVTAKASSGSTAKVLRIALLYGGLEGQYLWIERAYAGRSAKSVIAVYEDFAATAPRPWRSARPACGRLPTAHVRRVY